MIIEEMYRYLKDNNLAICKDNIIRDDKNHPKCPNPVFQALLEELQDNGKLEYQKETLYGQCFMSLIEICLNNKHFKYQTPEIKDECRLEALLGLETLPKYFDKKRGSTAYAFSYRIIYTNMIHILEKKNIEREFMEKLKEEIEEQINLQNSAHRVITRNVD